jgi:AcrR family transcriptional regulator
VAVAQSTRDLILAAAVELMRTQGLARTTTKEIARAAGYSEATLYKHFRDKDELFLAALREQMPATAGVFARLPEWPGQSTVRAHLEEIVLAMVPFLELSVPIGGSLFSQPTLLEKHQQLQRAAGTGPHRGVQEVAAYLRAEQKLGRLSKQARPEAAAQLLLGACFQRAYISSFMGPGLTPEPQPLEQFAKDVVRTLLRGMEPAQD